MKYLSCQEFGRPLATLANLPKGPEISGRKRREDDVIPPLVHLFLLP
jgi:hypothetical protein